MYCSQCDSDNIQKLSLVYESGVTHSTSKTRGTGIGFGPGGVGVGVGGGTTKGVHVSATAQRAAPPMRQNVFAPILLAIVALFFLMSHLLVPLASIVMLIAIGLAFVRFRWNQNVFPGLANRWMQSYLCNRCGAMMIPVMAQPTSVNATPRPHVDTIDHAPSLPEGQTN